MPNSIQDLAYFLDAASEPSVSDYENCLLTFCSEAREHNSLVLSENSGGLIAELAAMQTMSQHASTFVPSFLKVSEMGSKEGGQEGPRPC